jgi:predicted transcriptional regulator
LTIIIYLTLQVISLPHSPDRESEPMADAVVTISAALAAALDALGAADGRSRAEVAREAIARYVLEERLTTDRVVAARLREFGLADDGSDSREVEPTGGEAVLPGA